VRAAPPERTARDRQLRCPGHPTLP
jgi:hypothetical protein